MQFFLVLQYHQLFIKQTQSVGQPERRLAADFRELFLS